MLSYKRGWKIRRVFECYSYNSILEYRKIYKILPKWFCFFKILIWIWQYDTFHTIIDKFSFVFKQFRCLWVLSPRIWNVLWMRFSKWFTASIKNGEMTQRYPKSYFSVLFWSRKYVKSKHLDCPLNPTLNTQY